MQILNITTYITALHNYLAKAFEHYNGLAFHNDKDPESGANTSTPELYDYLMPSTALNEGYPARCPCVVITVDSQGADNIYSLSLHTCVCYSAVANNEIVHKVDAANRYQYGTEGGFNTNSDVELYKSSLLLTEFVHDALCKASALNVRNISVELPAPDLQDFPYCISTVHFDTQINFIKAGQNAYHDYY